MKLALRWPGRAVIRLSEYAWATSILTRYFTKSGDSASLRFPFAFWGVNERYRDVSPTTATEGLEYQRRLGVYTFMIRQFAFRRILPVLLLLIHLTLLWWVWTQERHRSIESHPPMMWDVPPKPFSIALKASIVLNLPALLMSIPIRMFFPTTSDTSTFLASLPFVPLVWYGVGLWLDRLIGNVALPRNPRPTRRRTAAKTAVIFLCLGIMTISPLHRHREPNAYWSGGAVILWSTLFLGINATGLVEKRNT